MSKKKIIKKLEKIATDYGVEAMEEVINSIYCSGELTTFTDPPACGPGRVYNPILKRCVDDLG